ncbi:TonB-dependent receptor [Flagellimonas sp.]|uniref:TonB-dependent receptor n=1 Tax=Flagellimonas sp. TaxID=2058762 RepID=UPI003B5CD37D
MRKLFFIWAFVFGASFVNAQNTEGITIFFEDKTLKEVLLELEEKTNLSFFFSEEWLDNTRINKRYTNRSLEEILTDLFEGRSLNHLIFDHKVILTNNSVIHKKLPANFFDENKTQDGTENEAVFYNQYQKENVITVGKQVEGSSKETYSLSGIVTSDNNGEPLKGLNVFVQGHNASTTTDNNGYYELLVPSGLITLRTHLLGFNDEVKDILVYGDGSVDISVSDSAVQLDEVVVESSINDNVRQAEVGVVALDVAGIKNIPVVLGERDVLKVAISLPGIQTTGEGAAGFNVRGGRADQNLFLLDDAVIYTPSHFLGFFSAINPFATGSVDIYKASIPVKYGGRLSSVFDIKSKEPNYKKFSGEGSIGPITGNLSLQIPLKKEKSSLTVAGRATYSDWILRSLDEEDLSNSRASFYDGIIKYDHIINDKNKLQATGYYSDDRFSITSDSIFSYNNVLASIKWSHLFNDKNKGDLIVTNSQYTYGIEYDAESNGNFDFDYKINESQVKLNMKYLHSKKHTFDYGVSSKLYQIEPGNIQPLGSESIVTPRQLEKEKGLESAVYFSDLFEVNDRLLLNLGLRYSIFSALGPRFQNVYAEGLPKSESSLINTLEFDNNEAIKTYGGPEFRLSMRYSLAQDMSIKAGYSSTIQYIHLLSSNTTISPTDIWKLSDLNTKPQRAGQFSLGLFKNLDDGNIELSLEGYYKRMDDILDYKVGAELILNENIEQQLLQGEGKAYGAEFLIKKKRGNLSGWLGYSYSRAMLKLNSNIPQERINNGAFFPANYDKPHDISLVMNYKLTKRYSLSTNFVYQTGRPITFPVGKFTFGGSEQVAYSDRNRFRIPDYYRLDLGLNIEGNHKTKKLAHSFWNISVYNVLGRNNPYSVFFINDQGNIKAYKTSIFAIPVPTITYNFKF